MNKVLKIITLIRTILLIPLMVSMIVLFPSINVINLYGKILYSLSFVIIIVGIFGFLFKEHNINKVITYNIIYILVELLLTILFFVINRSIQLDVLNQVTKGFNNACISLCFTIVAVVINTAVVQKINLKKGLL